FTFEFKIERFLGDAEYSLNLWLDLGELALEKQKYHLSFMPGIDEQIVTVKGHLQDFKAEATQVLRLELEYLGKVFHFQKELSFGLDSTSISESYPISENVYHQAFRSIDDPFGVSANSLFYTVEGEDKVEISFFKQNGQEITK